MTRADLRRRGLVGGEFERYRLAVGKREKGGRSGSWLASASIGKEVVGLRRRQLSWLRHLPCNIHLSTSTLLLAVARIVTFVN